MNERKLCAIMKRSGYVVLDAWMDDNKKYIEFARVCGGVTINAKRFESRIDKNNFKEV